MSSDQDARYAEAAAQWGAALQRVARAHEADPERRRDLLQDMHVALWKSMSAFNGRCSMRTWVYRIASNVAANHVARERRDRSALVTIEALAEIPAEGDFSERLDTEATLARLHGLIRHLMSPDREVMTLYLEGLSAEAIGEVTGLSPGAIATRISRLKAFIARTFQEAER